ncbi:MAG: methionine gamma-lyase family protein [Clostridia bacterium]|nr:methionine gamma-lyase family protein [Clostridia bacterium]
MRTAAKMINEVYNIDEFLVKTLAQAEEDCVKYYRNTAETVDINQIKVLKAMQDNGLSDIHLQGSSGYGYGDIGRTALERIYADIFKSEAALVRLQMVSGTHALALAFLGNLSRGEALISATGRPYDTLHKVIGLHNEYGSLIQQGVKYQEIALTTEGRIDIGRVLAAVTEHTRMVCFQRSRGYDWRPSFGIAQLEEAIHAVKARYPQIICLVDNCYGEFVETREPTEAGADLAAGSLIKNPGGGLALTGGYLVGRKELIDRAAIRLTAPGIGASVGASLNFNRPALQGLFMAPLVVGEALKGAHLAARFFELLGYPVLPDYQEQRTDIIQGIRLGSKALMQAFCRGLQRACPLDSRAVPEPDLLPGYEHEVIMAGGTFIQGSSIELSADGPIRPPYDIFLQGGLTLSHVKIGLLLAAQEIRAEGAR